MNNAIIKRIMFHAGIFNTGFCKFSWVSNRLLECAAKKRIPEKAQTVIMAVFPYRVKKERPKNISRYAAVADYHKVCGDYLSRAIEALKKEYPENHFEAFVDNSPIPEVYAASAAGLGVVGDNGLLITPRYGSYVFIGAIVCDLKIECENGYTECMHCGFCKNACPVHLEKRDCLSAISQKKGELSFDEAEKLRANNIIWGCDICAEVCPFNRVTDYTNIKEFTESYRDSYTIDEDIKNRAYEWRGKGTVQRNYKVLNGKWKVET